MEITWRSEKLKQEVMLLAKSNEITARRMNGVKAALNFVDLTSPSKGRAHFLKGNLKNLFSLDLESKCNGRRLICRPIGDFQVENNQYVKGSIREIEIIKIEDTHK